MKVPAGTYRLDRGPIDQLASKVDDGGLESEREEFTELQRHYHFTNLDDRIDES